MELRLKILERAEKKLTPYCARRALSMHVSARDILNCTHFLFLHWGGWLLKQATFISGNEPKIHMLHFLIVSLRFFFYVVLSSSDFIILLQNVTKGKLKNP